MRPLGTRPLELCRPAVLAVFAFGTLLQGDMASEASAVQGPAAPVPALYFGMHVHRLLESTPWPTVTFSAIRLWDTRTTWSDLEPQKNEWRFNRLDRLVGLAEEHKTEVLLCFGKTPQWASSIASHGENDKTFQAGTPKDLDDWRTFVRTVAARYKGRIHAYEVWNEPSAHNFYLGDVATMVTMTRIAFEAIHSVDPEALVVSPSATGTNGIPWFDTFLAQGGGRYVDVIGYHMYATPDPPEQIPVFVVAIKSAMRKYKVDLPIWDTETGWSLPKTFSSDDEAGAYVARSLLLSWAFGVSRFYWYAWDNRNWVTLNLTSGDAYQPTAAAQAFQNIENWMSGRRVRDCARGKEGTWTCRLIQGDEESIIVWNPAGKVPFAIPASAGRISDFTASDLRGNSWSGGAKAIYANPQPLLLTHVPQKK